MGTAIHIWAQGNSKPVRVMLIHGTAELLSGMDIVTQLDITVRFGGDQFKVGKRECGMMTFSGNHHWVFPLVPTSSAYAKLNGYFGKLRSSKIEVLQAQGDFSGGFISPESFKKEQETTAR